MSNAVARLSAPGPCKCPQNEGTACVLAAGGPGERAPPTPLHPPHPLRPQLTSLHAARARPSRLRALPRPRDVLAEPRGGGAHIPGPQRAGPGDPVPTSRRGCRGVPVSPGEASTPGRTCSASAPGTDLISLPAASPPSAHGHAGLFPGVGPWLAVSASSPVAPSPSRAAGETGWGF